MPFGAASASLARGIAALQGDPLTGLPTRGAFMRALRRELATAGPDRLTGVLFIDVDGLKRVNDTRGHDGGDALLREAATRLGRTIARRDLVARVGGDEFAVLVRGRRTSRQVVAVADDLLDALARPEPATSASIGVAVGLASSDDRSGAADELVRSADLAMLRAKHRGGGHVEVFSPGTSEVGNDRAPAGDDTAAVLARALDAESFALRYQPAFCVGCGESVRVEALLRVQSPDGSVLVPDRLLRLAEATGRLDRITAWVLAHALDDAARWWSQGHRVPVAINISADELAQPSSTGQVLDAARQRGLPAGALVLEVHRTLAPTSAEALVASAAGLSAAGVAVVAEDADTDWSLGELAALRPETMTVGHSGSAVVPALLLLAQTTRSSVTAKAVETEAQLAAAVQLGCSQAQGCLLSPVTTSEAVGWRTSHLTMRDADGRVLTDADPLATVHACTTSFSYADRALADNQRSRDPSSPPGPRGFSRPRSHFDAAEES